MQFRPTSFTSIVRAFAALAFALFLAVGFSQTAQSQTFSVLHSFSVDDGASPYAAPTLDQAGNLYGTTNLGGTSGNGTVYTLVRHGSSWTFSSLYSFNGGLDGSAPGYGPLAFGPDGRPVGTTESGGNFGTAFSVKPSANICANLNCPWTDTILHRFGGGTDGAQPLNGVTFDDAGNFYGTANLGGAYGNGAVFEGTRSGNTWMESVLYSFVGGTDAVNPVAGLLVDKAGPKLYGTTSFGGANGIGAIYELARSGSGWTETVLYSFTGGSDGSAPVGGLVADAAGNLYGGTFFGGDNGGGVVYELSPSGGGWTFNTIYSFTGYYGPYNTLTFDAHGNLYGTTEGGGAYGSGSVFKLTPGSGGWTMTDLHDFAGGSDGGLLYGGVAVDAQGNVFGVTPIGGDQNQGFVYEIAP
jgi:uncharacterized repeat protein (TIGR03803 family)